MPALVTLDLGVTGQHGRQLKQSDIIAYTNTGRY